MGAGTKRIAIEDARNALAAIWFTGAGMSFILLAVQSMLGKHKESLQEVWAWFAPAIFPTSALILGVIGATALQAGHEKRAVKVFFFKLARALSVFYLFVLLLTMLLEPFSTASGLDIFTVSNYWLSPLQSVVVAAISVLFTSQEEKSV